MKETIKRILKGIPNFKEYSKATKDYIQLVVNKLDQLGKLDDLDVGALTILAREYENVIRISQCLQNGEPYTIVTPRGVTMRNPILQSLDSSENKCIKLMQDFGLTSRSRKNLVQNDTKTPQTNSTIDEFLD